MEHNNKSSSSSKVRTKFENISLNQSSKYRDILSKLVQKKWGSVRHSVLFYFLTWIILSTYGGKACPFIEGTTFTQLASVLLITLGTCYILRIICLNILGRKKVLYMKNGYYTLLETFFLGLWIGLLAIIGTFYLKLGGESLTKLVFGSTLLSLFVVINLVLIKNKYQLLYEVKHNVNTKSYKSFASLRVKFIFMAVFTFVAVGLAFVLTNYKNFHWLVGEITTKGDSFNQVEGILSVFKETVFVIVIFLTYIILTAITYTTNLILFFAQTNASIERLFTGDFSVRIPTLGNDEFGILSENIKVVSAELKEKKKLKHMFGKLVSPKVAEILDNEEEIKPGGDTREIIVLFSDIRNFTSYSETALPNEVIAMLNSYFSEIVSIIEHNDGIIDKFMGDGIMALFGLESVTLGINNAVHASIAMHKVAQQRSNPVMKIGVGIATGDTIVGLVGAQNRLDFTAIGDTVNTAARLESATKEYKQDIIISENMYTYLDKKLLELQWEKIDMTLKGKQQVVTGYGTKIL